MCSTSFGSVVDIEPTGRGALIWPARGRPVRADVVVLALGVVPSTFRDGLVANGAEDRCLTDAWDTASLAAIEPCATVTLLGTGLGRWTYCSPSRKTAITDPVQAVSRHGLLPAARLCLHQCSPGHSSRLPEEAPAVPPLGTSSNRYVRL